MKISKEELNQLGIAAVAFASGFLVKKTLEEGYRHIFDEEPPEKIEDEEFTASSILGWALVSGLAVSAAKIFVKRTGAKLLKTR